MTDLFLDPQEHQEASGSPSRRSRRQGGSERQRKKRRRQRRWITTVATLAVIGLIGVGVWKLVLPAFTQPGGPISISDYPGPGTGVVEVTVAEGQSGLEIGATLQQAGVVATQKAFYDAYLNNSDSQRIQPGTYRLMKEMSASDAVLGLLNPKNRISNKITIKEGWNTKQIYAAVAKALDVDVKDVQKAAKNTKAIHLPPEAKGNPEGWYFPDTYEYSSKEKPEQMLARMVDQMDTVLDEMGVADNDRLMVLTKASLVEKEVNRAEDRPKAARVIENRLKDGWKLELDSTVEFANGTNNLFTTDEERANPSPYNTYMHKGLPPGPIDSPSKASIQAVLAPVPGKWMYWCLVNPKTGETAFSETAEQHEAARQKLNQYIEANPDWNK